MTAPEGKKFKVAFENGKSETPAGPGSTVTSKISLVNAARDLENGTFDTEKSYAVEFTFSGSTAARRRAWRSWRGCWRSRGPQKIKRREVAPRRRG